MMVNGGLRGFHRTIHAPRAGGATTAVWTDRLEQTPKLALQSQQPHNSSRLAQEP
jgi:hypothetical protein